jgi:sec-independent protein translocase protein TatB
MFDIGFSELVVIGVVALIVIGPERLPKVARTAGHLLGRFQRYAASVKSDISREMQMDELRKVGQDFKASVESAASGVEAQVNVVDDYLKNEIGHAEHALTSLTTGKNEAEIVEADTTQADDAVFEQFDTPPHPQQNLDLETRPTAVIEHATPSDPRKPA